MRCLLYGFICKEEFPMRITTGTRESKTNEHTYQSELDERDLNDTYLESVQSIFFLDSILIHILKDEETRHRYTVVCRFVS